MKSNIELVDDYLADVDLGFSMSGSTIKVPKSVVQVANTVSFQK